MFTTQTGGTTGHDDFGQRGYDLFADFLTSDVALSVSTYGWYRSSITEYQATQDFTFTDNYQVWRYYYRVVNEANLVIQGIGGNDADPEGVEARAALGQAFAMRAYAYYHLVAYLTRDYNPSEEALPIYTEPGFEGKPKSTVGEVYELMESDLTRAIDLLDGFVRNNKVKINQPIAKGMLAYVIASTRSRWDEVAQLTAEAMAESGTSLMSSNPNDPNGIFGGFNNVSNPSWLWGVDLNTDTNIGLVSWWGQMDYFSYSYAAVGDYKCIDEALWNSMRPDDLRRIQFDGGGYPLQPTLKFYDENRVFFGASQIVQADYVYMRYAELHLLNAEALAKAGQEGPARDQLKILVENRLSSGDASYIDSLSGQDLIDEIYFQTRVELWGEGKTYHAMRRNQKAHTRGQNHLSFVGETIAYDEERMTFEIPLQEIQDNLFINSQNQ
jgi:hypothetical protein